MSELVDVLDLAIQKGDGLRNQLGHDRTGCLEAVFLLGSQLHELMAAVIQCSQLLTAGLDWHPASGPPLPGVKGKHRGIDAVILGSLALAAGETAHLLGMDATDAKPRVMERFEHANLIAPTGFAGYVVGALTSPRHADEFFPALGMVGKTAVLDFRPRKVEVLLGNVQSVIPDFFFSLRYFFVHGLL